MTPGFLGQAAGMFAVSNIDDMLVLAVFFGQPGGRRAAVVLGQYLGFGAILLASVLGALGAGLLPEQGLRWLGLLPLALGLRAAWQAWRSRGDHGADGADGGPDGARGAGVLQVAVVTLANGGDNVGTYVPVFAVAGTGRLVGFVVVFLVGVALWCALGWLLATRRAVAGVLARWGRVILPVVLVGIGIGIVSGW